MNKVTTMICNDAVQHTEATATPAVLSETVTGERIVPVWLSLDDLDIIDRSLQQLASTCEANPDFRRHVADLQKHFAWVRSEFATAGVDAVA